MDSQESIRLDCRTTDIEDMVTVLPPIHVDKEEIFSLFVQIDKSDQEPAAFKILSFNGRSINMKPSDETSFNQELDDKEDEDQCIIMHISSKELRILNLVSVNSFKKDISF